MIVRRNQFYRQGIGRLRFNADAIILHLAVIRIAVIWFIDPAAIVLIADYGPDSETIRDDRYIEGCVAAIIKASTVSLRSRNAHLSFKFSQIRFMREDTDDPVLRGRATIRREAGRERVCEVG